jgi:hypothetical protein
VHFQVAVRLPGNVSSNAPLTGSNGAVWQPSLSERAPAVLSAKGDERNFEALTWAAVALIAAIALIVLVIVYLVRRQRREARDPGSTVSPSS